MSISERAERLRSRCDQAPERDGAALATVRGIGEFGRQTSLVCKLARFVHAKT